MFQYLLYEVLNFASGFSFTPFLVCLCLVLLIVINCRRQPGVPPGPPLLPVIGNILTFSAKDLQGTLNTLRVKYGDVFSLYIGKELVIILNGYETIHDALVKRGRIFSHRPESAFQKVVMPFTGILFSNGKTWKEQRTFAQKTVKEICFEDGSKNIETVLREEVEKVLQKMDEFGTDPSEIQRLVQTYSLNVIIRIVYGDGFKGENENASYLIDAYHNIGMEVATMQVMVNCFPFLHSLPGDILGLKKFELKRQKLESVTKQFIQNSLNNNESCNKSFVEMYNEELERCKSGDKDTGDSFSERRMIHSCSDLIGAGSDTTANAIVWILLHLVREPEVQEKMFQEMTQQLGEKTEPMLSDRKSLPYAQAVILEGLRISNSTPLALPHSVSENLYFKNYFFPKDCTVLVNLASVLKDPEFFKDPNIFKPERFLSKDGSTVIDVDGFVPFSVGPRSCLGESLARMQLFLVVSSIVRRFKLLPEIDGQLPVAQGQLSTVYKPLPFLIRLLKR